MAATNSHQQQPPAAGFVVLPAASPLQQPVQANQTQQTGYSKKNTKVVRG